jgi:hypothetical protein
MMKKPAKKQAASSKPAQRSFNPLYVVGIISFLLGCVFSFGLIDVTGSNLRIATYEEKAKAEADISDKFLAKSSLQCTDLSDPIMPKERVAIFKQYLKVNAYANRAVIRGCNNVDNLLYKDKTGDWILSAVNITLDSRMNPEWQKACLIQDITRADSVVRPENKSIDTINLETCQGLPQ